MCFFYLLFAKAYTVVVITIYVWDKVFFKKKKKKMYQLHHETLY